MNDTLKDASLALFSLWLVSGIFQSRAEHAITHDLARSLRGGQLQASVQPRGLLGLFVGQSGTTRISGQGFTTETLPFQLVRGAGVRAYVHRLELDFTDFTLKSVPISRFYAEVPSVSLDINRAFWDERIILRSAGEGTGETILGADGLRAFIARKYPQFHDVRLTLTPGAVHVALQMNVLGLPATIEAEGRLQPAEGRYLDVVDPRIAINGKAASAMFVDNVLKSINPVLDIVADVGLGGYFYITDVEIDEGAIRVRGRVTIPRRNAVQEKK